MEIKEIVKFVKMVKQEEDPKLKNMLKSTLKSMLEEKIANLDANIKMCGINRSFINEWLENLENL